jgi:transcription initiation factor TFIIIB Brf1 subunit/transcription initiation factor TFIIB
MNKSPRSIKEIAKIFGLNCKKVTKGNKHFDRIIRNLDDNTFKLYSSNMDTVEDYVRRHCPKLLGNGHQRNIEIAIRIAHNCCRMKLASDHNPQSIAAGSILAMIHYLNLNIDKKKIVNLFETSDVTISKIYNKLEPIIDALVDDEITDHLIKKFKING